MEASSGEAESGSRLVVDLDALAANWRLLRDRSTGARCAAVVKADAYGIGLEPAGRALAKAGCETFFVAHLSEGRRLRAVLPDATIYVLNGLLPGSEPAYAQARLRPVLGSGEEVAAWSAFVAAQELDTPAALHVDTGMNRLGLTPPEARALAGAMPPLALVMSHFACADDRTHPLTLRQIEAFAAVRAAFPNVPGSLANSSGVFWGEPARHDLVRPGYALYGGAPIAGEPNPMRPVVTLSATILQVRDVADGETVGYGATWTARGRRRIATVCHGYADGWPRALSGSDHDPGGIAKVKGVLCPIAGRVSMDLLAVDVTDVPGPVSRGDACVLLDGEIGVDAQARRASTIGYTLLTALGRRMTRLYEGG